MDVETTIGIIDCGLGNLGSLLNMFKRLSVPACIVSQPSHFEGVDKLILPGVGAFDHGMRQLGCSGLLESLEQNVCDYGKPILGICLGMQLLTRSSEEGTLPGLGWVDASTVRFTFSDDKAMRVPHMGWNAAMEAKPSELFKEEPRRRYYFVHSYHVVCQRAEDVLATTHYGREFVSAIQKDNVIGVQFHPEKSHRYGMELLRRYALTTWGSNAAKMHQPCGEGVV